MTRINRVLEHMAKLQVDSVIIKDVTTIRYLTGFTGDSRQGNGGGSYRDAGYPAEPPAPSQHPAAASNAEPTASNGSYTAKDFVETTTTDDDYPF